MGVIIAILVAFVILGGLGLAFVHLMSIPEETSQEDEILQEILGKYHQKYKDALKIYNENPEKFWEYKQDFFGWQCKIEDIREEYFCKILKDPNMTDEWQKAKFNEMIKIYKDFVEWNQGKIE